MRADYLSKFSYLGDERFENGAWFEITYDYQYGDEIWEVDEYETEIFAYSRNDAVEKFFENKSEDFKKRVLCGCVYTK